ncbi:MAG: PilT/PilU family type 4a pilus ATPase [Gammaproteobacteria bacterium]|nr:PilT/PilU family type 4a pilus ATPase [Gammaproteobacteria bacterium]
MKVSPYLKVLAEKGGSDLYFSTGARPSAKFSGMLTPLGKDPAPPGWVNTLAQEIMNDKQRQEFTEKPEMNLAMSIPGLGHFRVNIFKQRNEVSMVIRNIVTELPDADDLGLPQVLKNVIMNKRGLILFAGGTGSGKSTSLAALIDYRNINSKGHIITIEDPVEYIHPHKGCIVNQREVGVDTDSFADALKNTLRQAPDVILIGEIRDRETMEYAMAFSETGHLAISTLHANNAIQALDRIINFFPEERRSQLLNDLSNNLQAFVSQRLIPTVDGGHCAAVEVLLNTSRIGDLILKGDIQEIKEVMEKSENAGMRTFDAALFYLYQDGKITLEETLKNADGEKNLRLRINLDNKGKTAASASDSAEDTFAGLSLIEEEVEEEEQESEQEQGHVVVGGASFNLPAD